MPSHVASKSWAVLAFLLVSFGALSTEAEINLADDGLPEQHQLVVFMVDGFLSKMVLAANMPLMQKFTQRGGVTTTMRTTDSMRSPYAGWISVFYAASPAEFGCNDYGCDHVPRFNPDDRSFLSILEEDYGYQTKIVSEAAHVLTNILEREEGEVRSEKLCTREIFSAARTMHLPDVDRRTVVVHFSCLDRLGEVSGYGSYNYIDRVHCLDKELTALAMQYWEHLPNATTFLLVSNHGGTGFTHSKFTLTTLNVAFAAWGYGFKKHAPFMGKPLITQQIGPTLFTALNISDAIPDTWLEYPMDDAVYALEEGQYAIQSEVEALLPPVITIDNEACILPFSTSHHYVRLAYIGVSVIFSVLLFASAFVLDTSSRHIFNGVNY